jgi:hypothetical protein
LINSQDKTKDEIIKAATAIKEMPTDVYPMREFYIETILNYEPDPNAKYPRKRQNLYKYVMKEIRYKDDGNIETNQVIASEDLFKTLKYKNKHKNPKRYAKYNIKTHNYLGDRIKTCQKNNLLSLRASL